MAEHTEEELDREIHQRSGATTSLRKIREQKKYAKRIERDHYRKRLAPELMKAVLGSGKVGDEHLLPAACADMADELFLVLEKRTEADKEADNE